MMMTLIIFHHFFLYKKQQVEWKLKIPAFSCSKISKVLVQLIIKSNIKWELVKEYKPLCNKATYSKLTFPETIWTNKRICLRLRNLPSCVLSACRRGAVCFVFICNHFSLAHHTLSIYFKTNTNAKRHQLNSSSLQQILS